MSATEIPASLVKELRTRTGARMMDCKRALVETGGDVEAAAKLLKEKGLAEAGKRAGRETTEGKVLARLDDGRGAIVAVGCETEPVSNNEEFLAFAERLLDLTEAEGPDAAGELEDERVALVAKLGENVVAAGAERYVAEDEEVVAAYVHPPAAKIGVLVRAKARPELARLVAMHIAAARPTTVRREDIPEADVAAERAIYEKLPRSPRSRSRCARGSSRACWTSASSPSTRSSTRTGSTTRASRWGVPSRSTAPRCGPSRSTTWVSERPARERTSIAPRPQRS